ncbi:hypothetical protein F9Z43_09025 [Pseudomonas monteilii]|uniref:Uncharacterized protein n=1 Tax=Pseudomonas monteilii TaxID=76759 RepID=A0A7X3JR50_9PSED|nr:MULTISPECIES: hypothetical protein [Pseudomonas]MDT3749598.1 hypothetical protein [Pseudomonas kurunegalensis]MVF49459.1 hypothetical protein [Pseudomonas monteilii]
MPTENRSSNTDPRDVFIRLNPLGLGEDELRKDSTGFEDQRTHSDYLLFLAGYRETHSESLQHIEQHQGEPVALPARINMTKLPTEQSSRYHIGERHGWNACLDEIAKLGPLYTRPVQGEPVAWQDPDNDSRMCTAEHKAYALSKGGAPAAALATLTRPLYTRADPAEIERLRTELDLRTQEREKFLGWCRDARAESTKLRAQLADRDALLRMVYLDEGTTDEKCARVEQIISASAEPSAPVEIDERADFERHVILTTGRPIDSELKRHPVRHDEYECRTMQTRWNDWQARAALDRKPS